MRLSMLALLLALVAAPLSGVSAQEQDENPAYGVWMTDGGKSKVHVHKCEGGLCSKIIWLKRALDTDGLPQLDELNQNISLRKRPVVGINILEGMTQTARYEWEGEVYNPEDGKSYKAYLALIKPDVLRLKGCMPMGWPCRSKFWKKLDEEMPSDRPDTIMAAPDQEQLGEAPRQLANNDAVAPQGQPEVTTQSVTEGAPRPLQAPAQRPVEIARAPEPEPAPPPQALTPPRQLTPPPPPVAPRQQAAPEPVAPPQQATRVPDIPPPPPLPEIARQPAPQAAPPVAAQRPPPPPPVAPRQQAAIPAPPPPPAARPAAPQALPQQPAPEGRRFAALPPTAPSRPQSDDGERYLVQVAARQNKKEAMDVFYDLRRRYPQLLGSAEPIIMKVDLGDLGIWYRVRVGPITGKSAALAFCNRLKFAGSDCFIRRQ